MNRIAAHRSAADGSADPLPAPLSDATRHPSARPLADKAPARTSLLVVDTSTDACAVAVCVPLPLRADPTPSLSAAPTTSPLSAQTVAASILSAWPEITIRDDLVAGVRIVACWRRTGAVSSEALLPMVQAVLDAADIPLQACGAIAFGAGPGSFTGVRTATGAAQGLAFANDMPVVPLDTLMACAESARQRAPEAARPTRVYVAVDARMGECYAAAFSWCEDHGSGVQGPDDTGRDGNREADGDARVEVAPARPFAEASVSLAAGPGVSLGHWRIDIDAHVAPPSALRMPPADWQGGVAGPKEVDAAALGDARAERSPPPAANVASAASVADGFVLAGNAVSVFGDTLSLRALASACDDAAWPEPLALAVLGWRRWHDGAAVPAAMAQPRYIRDKVALTTQERLAVKEAKSASKEGGA